MAQTVTLRGRVTDASGAAVPGAKVTMTGAADAVKTVSADGGGSYSFVGVAPGDYTVRADAPNLTQPQAARISLQTGVQTLNLTLQVAATVEKVTVRENAAP